MENTHLRNNFRVFTNKNEKLRFYFFKTKSVTQIFITDMQVKAWKSLYTFNFF